MPQMDSQPWGVMPPQRSPFPWGSKTHKHSIWYLYSNPMTTYSELMVAAHKVESETGSPISHDHRVGWWLYRAEQPNHKVDGCPDQDWTG